MVLRDPLGGELLLGVEEVLDVVQDQVLERAADQRDPHLADAGQSQLATGGGVGVGEKVLPAEPARPARNGRRVVGR